MGVGGVVAVFDVVGVLDGAARTCSSVVGCAAFVVELDFGLCGRVAVTVTRRLVRAERSN